MSELLTNEQRIYVVALDFEQRRRAMQLVDAVANDPDMAACELIWLRDLVRLNKLTNLPALQQVKP